MEAVCREAVGHGAAQQIARALAQRLEVARQLAEAPHAPSQEPAYAAVAAAMDEALASLERLHLPPDQRPAAVQVLWSIAGAWLRRGWLQTRAWTKPRGYAGDYELLAAIFHHRLSDDPLGGLLDRYFQSQAAPQAVRNRMALASTWIRQTVQATWAAAPGPADKLDEGSILTTALPHTSEARSQQRTKVAIIGSATGLEVRQALRALPASVREGLEVILLDYDPAALAHAQHVLSGWLPAEHLRTAATNLARLPRRHAAWEHAPCDLVLVPGLLDYLGDSAAAALIAWGYAQLVAGGRLVVFQFAPHNPPRPYMEWIGDWRLIYRDREELAALARDAGLSDLCFEIGAEPLGVDLYLSVVRP